MPTPPFLGALDIGGTKIAAAVIDAHGGVLSRREMATDSGNGFVDGLQRMVAMLREAVAEARVKIGGIGIGCTGPLDPLAGVLGSVDLLPGWKGAPIVAALEDAFGVPAAIENDADAAALAEYAWGAGRGKRRFLYVSIGTGIGVSLLIDGVLYRGVDGFHPEMGHHVIDVSGPPCYCGARGCWEMFAAGPAIESWFRSAAGTGPGVTLKEICSQAAQGEPVATSAIERLGFYLGVGLANLVMIFCPDGIALGGGVMAASHLFLDRARAVVAQHCSMVPFRKAEIVVSALGADAPVLGAAQVWHHRFGGPSA